MIKLSIVVLSYNTKKLLEQTLRSIPENDKWEVIVVDNGSDDGSFEMLKSKYKKVKTIRNSKNLGFAGGNNVGIKASQGKYVMLLNSDTKIINDSIEKMVGYLEKNKEVGAVGPKLMLPDGAIDLACHRSFPTPWNALSYFLKLEQTMPNSKTFGGYHRTWEDFNESHDVEVISAGAMMVRREVIDEVGLLDEQFFLYGEDIDWCKRIYDAGWRIVYLPESVIIHFKSQSGKSKSGKKAKETKNISRYHFFNTMKQYYEKHYPNQPKWFKSFVKLGVDVFSGGISRKKIEEQRNKLRGKIVE